MESVKELILLEPQERVEYAGVLYENARKVDGIWYNVDRQGAIGRFAVQAAVMPVFQRFGVSMSKELSEEISKYDAA